LLAIILGIVLSIFFWGPLWTGGTLIGGDLFSYFFPQKAFLADELQAGRWPLWNSLTGHGYPTIAESQTGVCYPPDLLAYRWLSLTTAYNTIQISHYLFAFVGAWFLARRLGAGSGGALLAATSFAYGWFPPRICLEWAIVTGAYLPWAMWCAESYLQQPRRRFLLGLCVLLTLQMLAGHFQLAFITQLLLVVYVPLRSRLRSRFRDLAALARNDGDNFLAGAAGSLSWLSIYTAILLAFPLAAVQLLPTWELKQRSQREAVSPEHQPAYGHIPPAYWTQAITPWIWYMPQVDETVNRLPRFSGGPGTNQVEAHLYFGIIPLGLAFAGILYGWRNRSDQNRTLRLWFVLGVLFLLYTPGWFLPLTQYWPGFNFFRGPGRFGIVTSLAVALIAGVSWSQLVARYSTSIRTVGTLLILTLTAVDLHAVAQRIGYSRMLPVPIAELRNASPLKALLAQETQPVRLFAPMANVANLLNVSATPVYLGIGPREYFDPQFTMPVGPEGGLNPAGDPAQFAWLNQAGVTHLLSLQRLSTSKLPLELIWTGADPLLTTAFGRSAQEPFFFYRLKDATGRIAWENPSDVASAEITSYFPREIRLRVESPAGGRVMLRDLAYPGWQVTVDGQPQPPETAGMFRAVTVTPGQHDIVWSYRPASVFWGAVISVVTLVGLLSASVLRRRTRNI